MMMMGARTTTTTTTMERGQRKEEQQRERRRDNRRQQQQQQRQLTSTPNAALRLFLDSADVQEWRRWFPLGSLYGFTTNPLILQRDGVPCTVEALSALVAEARALGAQELQLQAWGSADDPRALLACARRLAALDPTLVTVKLPCTPAGLEAARALMLEGVPVAGGGGGCGDDSSDSSSSDSSDEDEDCLMNNGNTLRGGRVPARVTVTAVYSAQQSLLAQALGADYAAPYVGRMADAAGSTSEAEAEVAAMARAARLPAPLGGGQGVVGSAASPQKQMRVLVASLRDAATMARLAAAGCDTFTFSPAVMEEVALGVEATTAAALAFEAAAREGGGYAEGQPGAMGAAEVGGGGAV